MDESTARIELRRKAGPSLWAVIDQADLERVQERRWCAVVGKWATYVGSTVRFPDGHHATMYLHRFIMDAPAGLTVDHIDHDGLNNRRSNLRLATGSQNLGNTRNIRRGSSRFKGVSWEPSKRAWSAGIQVDRRRIFLGRYTSEEEAARVYDSAALEIFGQFACMNFPHEGAA